MTLLSPNIHGGASSALGNSQFSDLLRTPEMRSKATLVAQNNIYWGDQPFVSGPVYLGIIVFFLAILRSEEHTSELQSRPHLVCRLLLEKKKKKTNNKTTHIRTTTISVSL